MSESICHGCAHWHSDGAYCLNGHPIMCRDFEADGAVSRVQRTQIGGDHYTRHAIQPWDIISEYKLDFWEGNALKYLLRRKGKRLEDLEKCRHYLDYLIERERAEERT